MKGLSPFTRWVLPRTQLLIKAYEAEKGPHHTPSDWSDFCEFEYRRWSAAEISTLAYIRFIPGQPAQI